MNSVKDLKDILESISATFENISFGLLLGLSFLLVYLVLLMAIGQLPEEWRAVFVVGIPLVFVYVIWKSIRTKRALMHLLLWLAIWLILLKVLSVLSRML
jgi:hypothetical protein